VPTESTVTIIVEDGTAIGVVVEIVIAIATTFRGGSEYRYPGNEKADVGEERLGDVMVASLFPRVARVLLPRLSSSNNSLGHHPSISLVA
jgi:hypothetical protein